MKLLKSLHNKLHQKVGKFPGHNGYPGRVITNGLLGGGAIKIGLRLMILETQKEVAIHYENQVYALYHNL